jgi:hypothetical protein
LRKRRKFALKGPLGISHHYLVRKYLVVGFVVHKKSRIPPGGNGAPFPANPWRIYLLRDVYGKL